jgi:hypothetical protein
MFGLKKLRTQKISIRLRECQQLRKRNGSGILTRMSDDPLISALGKIDQHALWASCLWGAIASGYWIYGWKQKMLIPCLGGFAMTAVCFMSSVLWMSLLSIAIMFAVWWLVRQGY